MNLHALGARHTCARVVARLVVPRGWAAVAVTVWQRCQGAKYENGEHYANHDG
jgi:hypothetical protein